MHEHTCQVSGFHMPIKRFHACRLGAHACKHAFPAITLHTTKQGSESPASLQAASGQLPEHADKVSEVSRHIRSFPGQVISTPLMTGARAALPLARRAWLGLQLCVLVHQPSVSMPARSWQLFGAGLKPPWTEVHTLPQGTCSPEAPQEGMAGDETW